MVFCLMLSIVQFFLFSNVCFAIEKQNEVPVEIKAKSAILMECTTGQILAKFNEHEKLPPASVTKVMPLLLFVEAIDNRTISLGDNVVCSPTAASKGGSQIWLKEGETMTVDELLKAVAVASANDATTALGEHIAGSEEAFVKMMNDRAKELGMNDTIFYNCSGLDDTDVNITSAHDVGLMSAELMKHDLITKYTTIWMDSLRNGATELVNTNKLVRFYQGATGVKTGTTSKAGSCLSASAMRDNLHLIAVVMGSTTSDDRFNTSKALLNWGFANFTMVKPMVDKNLITDVMVIKGEQNILKPSVPEIKGVMVKKGEENKIKQKVTLPIDVTAPVEKGQTIGKLEFLLGNDVIASYSLYSENNIDILRLGVAFKRLLMKLV